MSPDAVGIQARWEEWETRFLVFHAFHGVSFPRRSCPSWSFRSAATALRFFAVALFAQRFTLHLEAVSVGHQPVENAVGQSGIADLLVPLCHRELAGQDRRSHLLVLNDAYFRH